MIKASLSQALIMLEVGERTALFILLNKDGTIHRKGNGSPTEHEQTVIEGRSFDGHFEALMMTVPENIFEHAGVLKLPNPQGRECKLTIVFTGPNGADYGFRCIYGEESGGLPAELAQIVINAVKLTEPWYQQQLQAPAETEKKKWWQVWK